MPHTCKTYMEEAMLRLNRYEVQAELDDGSAEMLVNLARRDVQLATIGLFPERYAGIHRLDLENNFLTSELQEFRQVITRGGLPDTIRWYGYQLPDDFIEEVAVYVKSEANGDWWRARKTTKQEMWAVSRSSTLAPTVREPMYFVEKDTDSDAYRIACSHGGTPIIASEWIEVWYKKALRWLQMFNSDYQGNPDESDIEVAMNYEFEEWVVYRLMIRVLEKLNWADQNIKQIIDLDIQRIVSLSSSNFSTSIDEVGILVPSKRQTWPVPTYEVPHEAPQQ